MSPRNHADCVGNDCDAVKFRSLQAQFGLTPKSRRGLAAEVGWFHWIGYGEGAG